MISDRERYRSFIVAVDKIDKIEREQLTINKKPIPVSEAYSQNLVFITRKRTNR
jgi:two-component system, LytTR family, response regulator